MGVPPLHEDNSHSPGLAAETGRGSSAEQQRVPHEWFERRDLCIIISINSVHHMHVARTPVAAADSRCSSHARRSPAVASSGRWGSSVGQGPLDFKEAEAMLETWILKRGGGTPSQKA